MREPKTLGEAVEQGGYAEVMLRLGELAHALGRIPCGEWDYTFTTDPRWRICLNGGTQAEWQPPDMMAIPRYHAGIAFNGWAVGLVNPAEGTLLAGLEGPLLAAIAKEIASGPEAR